jgi:hypothetical protein
MKIKSAFLLIFSVILFNGVSFAQEGWSVTTGLQYSGGNYYYNNYSKLFSFYGGVRYQSEYFSVNVTAPIIFSNNNSLSQSGGMMLPIGGNSSNNNNMMGSNTSSGNTGGMMGGSSGGSMMGSNGNTSNSYMPGSSSSMNSKVGLGDIYLSGNYQFYSDYENSFTALINYQIKFPTASGMTNIGTGKYDFGASVTLRKGFDSYLAIVDLGYLNIVDPNGITYNNPFTYGIGFGKYFNDGNSSLLLYYQGYTEIVSGYAAPQQLSLGFNHQLNSKLSLTLIGGAGLTKFSPGLLASAGVTFHL